MAEIALAVIPLIGEAYKTYRKVWTELKAFRHYARDLDRTSRKLALQRDSFKLECWILLKSAVDADTVRQLKADPYNEEWSNDIDAEFQKNIGSSYQSCLAIVQDVSGHLKELESELLEFAPLINDKRENESLSDAVRRLRKRFHVTVNRKKYEQVVGLLKESNNDLTSLREKIERVQSDNKQSSQQALLDNRRSRGDWGAACKARRASSALYSGMQEAWTCQSSPHGHHSMRLFLDAAEPKSRFPMNMSMSMTMHMSLAVVGRSTDGGRVIPTAFHLSVDSQNMQWAGESSTTTSGPNCPARSLSIEEEHSRKRMKTILPPGHQVSIPELVGSPTALQPATPTHRKPDNETPSYNLGRILDLCGHFGEHCLCPVQSIPRFIGYLDVPGNEHVRHNFYRDIARSRQHTPHDENIPLSVLLANSDFRNVNVHQRLMLARAVAVAALTYYDTPWLKDFWRLRDISLLFGSPQDVGTVLQTLHLEVDLMKRGCGYLAAPSDESAMDIMLTPESATQTCTTRQLSEDDLYRQGIYNKTIHSLGVALVGIENSSDLDPSNSDDVVSARKLSQSSMFGGKYKALVRKCLAYDCDLARPKMHKAAFESIVGSLEDMVSAMGLEDDD